MIGRGTSALARRDRAQKKGLIMGSQFKVRWSEIDGFLVASWLMTWSTRAPIWRANSRGRRIPRRRCRRSLHRSLHRRPTIQELQAGRQNQLIRCRSGLQGKRVVHMNSKHSQRRRMFRRPRSMCPEPGRRSLRWSGSMHGGHTHCQRRKIRDR